MTVKRCAALLFMLMLCLSLVPSAGAETDPNAKVSDCLGKDCSKKETPLPDKDQAPSLTDEQAMEPKKTTAGDYVRTLLAFVFVIGLLIWLLRFLNKRSRSFDQNRLMTNLGGVALGQHKSIQLIKMGNSYFVVGVGENVQLLKEIDDPAEAADLLARYEELGSDVQKGLISQLYNRFFSKNKADSETQTEDFSNVFAVKMNEMKAQRKEQLDRLKKKGSDRDG